MLAKAVRDHNLAGFKEYAERLAANRQDWRTAMSLEENVSESVLDLQITGADNNLSVKEVIKKRRVGELKMDDLSADDRLW